MVLNPLVLKKGTQIKPCSPSFSLNTANPVKTIDPNSKQSTVWGKTLILFFSVTDGIQPSTKQSKY